LWTNHCALTVKLQSQANNQNITNVLHTCTLTSEAKLYSNSKMLTLMTTIYAVYSASTCMTFKHTWAKAESAIHKYSIISVWLSHSRIALSSSALYHPVTVLTQ